MEITFNSLMMAYKLLDFLRKFPFDKNLSKNTKFSHLDILLFKYTG